MAKYLWQIICVLIGSFIVCCSSTDLNSKIPTLSVIHRDSVLVDTCLFKNRSIVVLEACEKSLISKIDRIVFYKHRYFVLDKQRQSVVVFNENGKFINSVRRIGRGPGEFIQITDFCVDRDKGQLIILCSIPEKLLFYDCDGNFLREATTEKLSKQVKVDRKYIYLFQNSIDKGFSEYCDIAIIDKINQRREVFLTSLKEISNLHSSGNEMVEGDRILFGRRFDNIIYQLKDGTISPQYKLDFGKWNLPERMKKSTFPAKELYRVCREKDYVFTILNVFDIGDFIFFKTNLPGVFYISKKSKEVYRCLVCVDNESDCRSSRYLPVEGDERKMAFVFDSRYFLKYKQQISKYNLYKKDTLRLGIANRISEDSNPVLFVYDMK